MVTAVRHLDTIATDIRRADNVRVDMETPSTLAALLALYGMTFTARGRDALVRVLTTSDHLYCLLELCRHSSQEGKKDMKKSAIRGFASELLLLCVRSSEDMDWLQRYGTQLFELGRHDVWLVNHLGRLLKLFHVCHSICAQVFHWYQRLVKFIIHYICW